MKLASGVLLCLTLAAAPATREIGRAQLHDKIRGGWAGQMIGVSYGAPTEFKSNAKINESTLPEWKPERVSNSLSQDDLYVDMTFAKVLDEKGIGATTEDFGAMFKGARYRLWHANLAARRALRRGVPAALSGTPKYNAHANDIDFQIEADFIGLMAPGLYQSSNDIAARAGRVMNYGDGIYGGMFISCMYAAAYFENDVRAVVEAGLKCIPAKSPYAMLISDVLAWHKQYPKDWRKVWQLIEDKWDKSEPCPEGALKPFNIDAKLNGGYVALGLLFGERDFARTLEISTRAGQDSDCNPASAAGVLGVMVGYDAIPDLWKGGIPALADKKFDFTDYSFNSIVSSTEKRALALIRSTGGREQGDRVVVKVQTPQAPALELFDNYGSPRERIAVSDARWNWKGGWKAERNVNVSGEKGAEASITFDGTGAIVVGTYLPKGGRYDVYLDGKLDQTLDACSDEADSRGGESIWHAFGLKAGKHSVRVVVRGEPFGAGGGMNVALSDLLVFAPEGSRSAKLN